MARKIQMERFVVWISRQNSHNFLLVSHGMDSHL